MNRFTNWINNFWNTQTKKAKNTDITAQNQYYVFSQSGQKNLSEYTKGIEQVKRLSYYIDLVGVYNDVHNDLFISGLFEKRFTRVMSNLKTFDRNGKENDIFSQIFDKNWFYEVCKQYFESHFFGYSAFQILFDSKEEFYLVNNFGRELYNPLTNQFYFKTDYYPSEKEKIDSGLLVITNSLLGQYEKIAPFAILRKDTVLRWNLFNQKYGTPTMVLKSISPSPEAMQKLQNFAENIGSNGWGVMSNMDEIELHTITQNQNHYEPFINYLDKRIEGFFLGNEKESSNYSEIDSKDLDFENIVKQDRRKLLSWLNNDFMTFIRNYKAYRSLPDFVFDFDNSTQMPILEQIKIDEVLLRNGIKLDTAYLEQKYKVVIDKTQTQSTEPQKAQKDFFFESLSNFYGLHEQPCCQVEKSFFVEKAFEFADILPIIERILRAIYAKNKVEFDKELATYYATILNNAYKDAYDNPDEGTQKFLRENIFKFSAAKTIQEIKDFNTLLYDAEGKIKPFTEFRKDIIDRATVFNENYLRTEYDMVYTVAQNTRVWDEGIKDGFKVITYKTVGDGRVRPEHKALNGITLKATDSFWKTYTPPNGWNCRCTISFSNDMSLVKGSGKDYETLGQAALDNKALFGKNFATSKEIFTEAHPYFSGLSQKQEQIIIDFSEI